MYTTKFIEISEAMIDRQRERESRCCSEIMKSGNSKPRFVHCWKPLIQNEENEIVIIVKIMMIQEKSNAFWFS